MTKPAQVVNSIPQMDETQKVPQAIVLSTSSVNPEVSNTVNKKMIAQMLALLRAKNPGFTIGDNLEISKTTYSYH